MKKLFFYYKDRVIIPWIIAVVFYFFVFNLDYHKDIIHIIISLIGKFIVPYFHLWFICGFLSYVVYLWFFRNYSKKFLFLFVSFLFSIFLYLVHFHIPFWWSDAKTLSEKFLSIFLYTFRDYFLVFFVFGYFLRERYSNNFNKIAITIFAISFILNILAFYYKFSYEYKTLIFYFMNFSLIYLIVGFIKKQILPSINFLEYIGKQSLGFYLWHMIPILIIKKFCECNTNMEWYMLNFIGVMIFYFAYKKLERFHFVNKYLFGTVRKY